MSDGLPHINKVVIAKVQHCTEGFRSTVELIAVKEDDVSWRFADDNSELAYDWDVMSWEYKE